MPIFFLSFCTDKLTGTVKQGPFEEMGAISFVLRYDFYTEAIWALIKKVFKHFYCEMWNI